MLSRFANSPDRFGLPYKKIGRHYGKNRFLKIWGLAWRSLQLLSFVLRNGRFWD